MLRSHNRGSRRVLGIAAAIVMVALCASCGVHVPTDPRGTLDRVEMTGELRAGATPAGEALRVEGSTVRGPLADLVEGFAGEHGAQVDWVIGSEETLVGALQGGDLDVVVGGMTDATPWSEQVSVTRGYPGIEGADGKRLVVMLPRGENALQSAIERYLDQQVAQ